MVISVVLVFLKNLTKLSLIYYIDLHVLLLNFNFGLEILFIAFLKNLEIPTGPNYEHGSTGSLVDGPRGPNWSEIFVHPGPVQALKLFTGPGPNKLVRAGSSWSEISHFSGPCPLRSGPGPIGFGPWIPGYECKLPTACSSRI